MTIAYLKCYRRSSTCLCTSPTHHVYEGKLQFWSMEEDFPEGQERAHCQEPRAGSRRGSPSPGDRVSVLQTQKSLDGCANGCTPRERPQRYRTAHLGSDQTRQFMSGFYYNRIF